MQAALHDSGVPIPAIVGFCPEPPAIVMQWVRGGRDPDGNRARPPGVPLGLAEPELQPRAIHCRLTIDARLNTNGVEQ